MDLVTASETFGEIPALGQSYRFLSACYLFQLHGVFGVRRITRYSSQKLYFVPRFLQPNLYTIRRVLSSGL
jgi:hypothetical protein